MKYFKIYLFLILVFITQYLLGQTVIRAKKFGGTSDDFFVNAKTDKEGFIYALGYYQGTLNIDSAGVNKTYSGFGGYDIFFGKFDCQLNPVWINRIGSTNIEGGDYKFGALEIDDDGSIYVTGSCWNNTTFTSTSGPTFNFLSTGGTDGFLAKYNNAGVRQWVIGMGSTQNDESNNIALDSDGFIYLVGGYRGVMTFGTTSGLTATRTSNGSIDAYVIKYSKTGVLQTSSTLTFGGLADDLLSTIVPDYKGHLYLSGGTCCNNQPFALGPVTITNQSSWGGFFFKMDRNMNVKWVNQMSGSGSENTGHICLIDSGQFYLNGHFSGTMIMPSRLPGTTMSLVASGFDMFIAKYDTAGVLLSSKKYGNFSNDYASTFGMIVNNRYEPIITGLFTGTVNFDGNNLVSYGGGSSYVIKLTRSLVADKVLRLGGTSDDYGRGLTLGKFGELYAVGLHTSPGNFGSLVIGSNGIADGYIAQIANLDDVKPPLPASISCTSAILRIPNPLAGASYQWLRNNIAIPGATDTVLQTNQSGQYTYTITGACNMRDTSMPYILNAFISIPSTRKDTTVCSGATFTLQGTTDSAVTNFIWQPTTGLSNPTSLTPTVTITTPITYQLIKFYSGGCVVRDTFNIQLFSHSANAGADKFICRGDSVQLNANTNGIFFWNTRTDLSDSTVLNPIASPDTTKLFVFNSFFGNCIIRDTVLVTVLETPVANAGVDTTICLGQSIVLSGSSTSSIFYWNTANGLSDSLSLSPVATPNQTTTYILTSGAGNCRDVDSVVVTVNPTPDVIAGADESICKGDTIQLNGTANGIFYWNTTSGLSDSTVLNPFLFPEITTNYVLTSILGNCEKSDTIQVLVYPVPEVTAGNDTIVCQGESYMLNATVSNADVYNWSPPAGLSNTTILNPIFTGNLSEEYVLTVENSIAGCINSDTIRITVEEVIASFTADSIEGNVPLGVQFTNTSTNAVSYLWDFGNGENSTQVSPKYIYEKVGEYLAYLIAYSQNGCVDTSQTLFIKSVDEIRIAIPNVFTPNGDKNNEVFMVYIDKMELVKYIKGSIWNRWGGKIHEFNMPGGKWWDGTYENELCQEGAYVYIVEVADYKGKIYKFSGTVTLMR